MPDESVSPANVAANAQNYLARDLRLDRIITWILTTLVGLGITIAIFTYRDLKQEFTTLSNTIVDLNKTVAIIGTTQPQIADNEKRIHELELWQASMKGNSNNAD